MNSSPTYTKLLIKHFENSVPKVVHIPIPQHLQHVLASILILYNPNYPNHFLNGCYLILQDNDTISAPNESDKGPDYQISSPDESLFRLVFQCADERWHHRRTWNIPLFSRHLPLVVKSRLLGSPYQPDIMITSSAGLLSEGPALVLSMKPSYMWKAYAALQCYHTQLFTKSRIVDGEEYFSREYPAKSFLAEHETTLAWFCGAPGRPVGYVQYTSLENEEGELHVLITGLAVEDSHRRRGFGQALIFAVVSHMWHCKEIWVAVQEENKAASSLYFRCGFVMRKRHWNFSGGTAIPKT